MQPLGLCNYSDPSKKGEFVQVSMSQLKSVFEAGMQGKEPRGMATNPRNHDVYLYTANTISKITMDGETRDVWRLYLEKALDSKQIQLSSDYFEIAQDLVKDDAKKRDMVLIAKADFMFKMKNYDQAAKTYAITTKSFEEVAIAFHNAGQRDALRKFLFQKLKILSYNQADEKKDLTQLNCLCVWLTELYLDKMNQLQDGGEKQKEEYRKMQQEFRKFMEQHKDTMDKVL